MDEHNLHDDLAAVLNRYSRENESNTPDFVLATYLERCLNALDAAVVKRAQWYGRMDRPGAGALTFDEETERLRNMLHAIVGSAYGETTYPGGRTVTEVSAAAVNVASKYLGYTRQIGV